MKKMCFIVNPCSGKVRIRNSLLDVITIFNKGGYDINIVTTMHRGHATEIAASLGDDVDIVAVSGGDGTLNEVLTGLLKSGKKLPVGYIPTGSTNDFASSFGIDSEPKNAAKAIVDGEPFDIDVGKFDGKRYFSYIASFGIFTAASYKTPQNIKNTFGHLAYVLEGIKDMTNIVPYNVTLEADGRIYKGRYIFGSITNTTSVGGIVKLRDGLVKMNDGLFEIVLVKNPSNINELSKIIGGLTTSDFADSVFEFVKASKVRMKFDCNMDWSIDGEHASTSSEIIIENIKTGASIIK